MASSAEHAAARIGGLVAQICAGTGNHRELARELASVVIPELNKYMGAATSKKLKLPKNSVMLLQVLTDDGEKAVSWHVSINSKGVPTIKEGRPASKPSIVASAPLAKLVKMAQGELNPIAAFMRGTIRVRGNVFQAQRLEAAFRKANGYALVKKFFSQDPTVVKLLSKL